MISPYSYIDEHVNDTFDELMKERDELVKEINDLEKLIFTDTEKKSSAWRMCPSPDVRYQVRLEYLSELCEYMSERHRDSQWSE